MVLGPRKTVCHLFDDGGCAFCSARDECPVRALSVHVPAFAGILPSPRGTGRLLVQRRTGKNEAEKKAFDARSDAGLAQMENEAKYLHAERAQLQEQSAVFRNGVQHGAAHFVREAPCWYGARAGDGSA